MIEVIDQKMPRSYFYLQISSRNCSSKNEIKLGKSYYVSLLIVHYYKSIVKCLTIKWNVATINT